MNRPRDVPLGPDEEQRHSLVAHAEIERVREAGDADALTGRERDPRDDTGIEDDVTDVVARSRCGGDEEGVVGPRVTTWTTPLPGALTGMPDAGRPK